MLICNHKYLTMNFQQIRSGLIKLGQTFSMWSESDDSVIEKAYLYNNWFTADNVKLALNSWSGLLKEEKLGDWLSKYDFHQHEPKAVAIIMAGNIPLVGLHDLICVLLSGNKALVKMSSDDNVLMKATIEELIRIDAGFGERIEIITERLPKAFDAVIATGSNNSNRYFEYYFRDKPHMLRKNRSSVALITGNETPEDFDKLAVDIFTYFGLGCRNVSKVYVPKGYDFTILLDHMIRFVSVIDHNKYANNYTYHKSIFLMNLTRHLDTGYLILKEDKSISSPLSVLFYEEYESRQEIEEALEVRKDEIQCVVGKTAGHIPFGQAQHPALAEYADGVDTLSFLLSL